MIKAYNEYQLTQGPDCLLVYTAYWTVKEFPHMPARRPLPAVYYMCQGKGKTGNQDARLELTSRIGIRDNGYIPFVTLSIQPPLSS
jgi:hypothetical protein